MRPSINDGDLAFVDAGCRRLKTDGIRSRPSPIQATMNEYEPQVAVENNLTNCGGVRA
jgi:hypothetical protein